MIARWPGISDPGHSFRYIERFRSMEAEGADLEGEARLIDAMAPRRARILDAGCGPGRTAGALHERGHLVVGIDIDPRLIEAAQHDHPGPRYLVADLAELTLDAVGGTGPFDAAVCAGNVMAFLAPDSETEVLTRIRSTVRPDGFLVVGFHVQRYPLTHFDEDLHMAGWDLEQRFATWDLRPWAPDSDFSVSVLRNPPSRQA